MIFPTRANLKGNILAAVLSPSCYLFIFVRSTTSILFGDAPNIPHRPITFSFQDFQSRICKHFSSLRACSLVSLPTKVSNFIQFFNIFYEVIMIGLSDSQ